MPASSSKQTADSLNLTMLSDRMCGDTELVLDLLTLFAEHADPMFGELRTAAQSNDLTQVKAAAHRFKGACLQINANPLAELLLSLERQPYAFDDQTLAYIETSVSCVLEEIAVIRRSC